MGAGADQNLILDQMRGGLGHAPGVAGAADVRAAGKRNRSLGATKVAADARHATASIAAEQRRAELALDKGGDGAIGGLDPGPEGGEVVAQHPAHHAAAGIPRPAHGRGHSRPECNPGARRSVA